MDPLVLLQAGCGFAATFASWAMAGFVYAAAPSRPPNRLAALFLALVGFQMVGTFGVQRLVGGMDEWEAVSFSALLAQSLVYIALMGTLDSPLSAAFRTKTARNLLLGAAALCVLGWPLLSGPVPDGDWYYPLLLLHGCALLYGFFVALSAWRRAPPESAARARGRAFVVAFGVRDVVFFVLIAFVFWRWLAFVDGAAPPAWMPFYRVLQGTTIPLSVIAMVLLMGYGMAKAQLFDVDVKIRVGLRRGTVGSAFVVAFLVVSQLVEAYSTSSFGVVGGAIAAGALLFALRPLERVADRIAVAATPRAQPLADLPTDDRAALYREQVALAWEDGHLDLKERRMLDVARERLRLSADDAARIERDALASLPRPTAGFG